MVNLLPLTGMQWGKKQSFQQIVLGQLGILLNLEFCTYSNAHSRVRVESGRFERTRTQKVCFPQTSGEGIAQRYISRTTKKLIQE